MVHVIIPLIVCVLLLFLCFYRRRDTFVSPTPIIDIPTPNPGAIYLQNTGAWQQMSQPRNYMAIGGFVPQTPADGVPLLFDTILIKIGSAITADVSATSTIFTLAPGFTYKCVAEIFISADIMYNWVHNNNPFGLVGVSSSDSSVLEPAIGYITNSGTTPMQVSVMRSTLMGDKIKALPGTALGDLRFGPFVIIESIA